MSVSPVPVGLLGGVAISASPELNASVTINGALVLGSEIVAVTLTAPYVPLDFPGLPARPPAGSVESAEAVGKNFVPGDVITLFAFEAAAIVAANGGTLS